MNSKEKDNIAILDPDLRDRLNSQRENKMLKPDEVKALHDAVKSASLAIEASYNSELLKLAKKSKTA